MKQRQISFHLLVTVFVCGQLDVGWTLHIEIAPGDFDLINQGRVNIACQQNSSIDQEANEIRILEIGRHDGKPLAMVMQGAENSYGITNHVDYQVQGHIDVEPSKSYLTLSLLNPKEEDKGVYQCTMYYLDVNGVLRRESSEGRLTMESLGVNTILEYTKKRIAMLEKEIQKDIPSESKVSAFSARYTVKGSEETGDTIVFNEVRMKVGQGYDEATGLYTAPTSGIYSFHLAAMMVTTYGWLEYNLEINGNIEAILSTASGDILEQGSVSTLVHLNSGDVVKVAVAAKNAGMKVRPGKYTFFSGSLIHETN